MDRRHVGQGGIVEVNERKEILRLLDEIDVYLEKEKSTNESKSGNI